MPHPAGLPEPGPLQTTGTTTCGGSGATVDASQRVRRRFRVGGTTTRGDAAISTDDTRINDRIRARQVRLIGSDGTQYGVKALPEALQIAREQGLDLVEVAAAADPPVCKIMDHGKYKYEQDQRRKESKRKASKNGTAVEA